MGGHGGSHCCQRKTLLHVWSLQKSTWMFHSTTGKIFCGQMKPKLSCLEGTHNAMCGEKKAQHTNIKTSSQLWNMVEGASWFGAALLPQGLDGLLSSTEKWIPNCIKTFCRKTDHLSANWSSTEDGWCNRTTTQSIKVNQQQNGLNRRKYTFWSGPVRVLTSTRLRCCGMTSREQFTPTQEYCWTETVL